MSPAFTIETTPNGYFLSKEPGGRYISGTAQITRDLAAAEITGWVAGWNAALAARPIDGWTIEHKLARQEQSA